MKPAQELFLDLIESAGQWNAFDGVKIAAALRANRSLWRAVILTDGGGGPRFDDEGEVVGIKPDLRVLRGLMEGSEGSIYYDIIRAIPKAGEDRALERLFESMHPDSIRWLKLEDSNVFGRTTREQFVAQGYDPDRAVLEAWWD